MSRPVLGLGVVLAFAFCAPSLGAAPREVTYRVTPGDTLSAIAARHGLSVAELCARNRLPRDGVLRPGQALRLPASSAPASKAPASKAPATKALGKAPPARASLAKAHPKTPELPAEVPGSLPLVSVGASGKAKPSLAKRDDRQPTAPRNDLAACSALGKSAPLAKCAPEGKSAPVGTVAPRQTLARPVPSWVAYSARPDKPGYLRLQSTGGRWSGQAVVGGWKIPEDARTGIAHALASWRSGAEERIHGRLIRLLARVSDQFGGRPIRIVSGYRPHAEARYTPHSKHTLGRAVDFSIPGVPNSVLRDFLRASFKDVGVGYYPNSTHVHLDIREEDTYWVDYSGPGQAPSYGGLRRPKALLASAQPIAPGAPASHPGVVGSVTSPTAPLAPSTPAGAPATAPSVPTPALVPDATTAASPNTPSAPAVPVAAPSETTKPAATGASAPAAHDTHTPEDP